MYKLIKMLDGTDSPYVILRLNDNGSISSIPNDMANADWQEYQAWLAADPENQPLPADE